MARNVIFILRFWVITAMLPLLGCGGAGSSIPEVPTVKPVVVEPELIQQEPIPEPEPEKVFLWKAVSVENEAKTVYLLGSVHMAGPDMYPLDPVIEEAYEASELLVVELDINGISPKDQTQLVLKKAALPTGQNLETILSAETWAKLQDGLAKHNVPLDHVFRFKPWFSGMTITTLRIIAAGYKPELGIDRYFLKKGNKQISALETVESQLSLYDNLTPELEELFVLDSLEAPLEDDYFKALMSSWVTGNAEILHEMVFSYLESRPEFAPLYKKIFDDRNHAMSKGIDELLKTHNTLFVVVGAGHMVGKEGLVAIFENKGYAVTQLEKKR